MSDTQELILAMSDRLDDTIKSIKENHKLPKDIEIEALSLSLFKSMNSMIKMGIHDKKTLEVYVTSVMNRYFMNAGLDLYIKKYDHPSGGFRKIN